MIKFFSLLLLSFCTLSVFSQTRVLVSSPINTKGGQEFNPSLSGDGKTMVFLSKLEGSNEPEFMVSYLRGGLWSRPELLSSINTPIKTVYTGDLTISHDGTIIVFTSGKYGGLGGNDIWMTEKKGNGWQAATNLGKPINSAAQEGDPVLSPDNSMLYFVRYSSTKTPDGNSCGKIYQSERIPGTNFWKEPVALPSSINMGCECNPRIAADNQTLYFSSMRAGGKGNYDQYISTLSNNTWSTPKALSFLNTPNDDRYIAITAQGTTVYYTVNENKAVDIASTMLPAEFQPSKVMYWNGRITNASTKKPLDGRVVIIDKKTNKLNVIRTNSEGDFHVFLTVGNVYDIAVQSNAKGQLYYSTLFDLSTVDKSTELSQEIMLSPVAPNAFISINNIQFETTPEKLTAFSTPELNRIVSLLKENPNVKIEIGVHTDLVTEDSISNPALSETTIDTLSSITDDSTGIISYTIKTTYHNNHTSKQAKTIVDYIIAKGIPASRISAKGYGDKKPLTPTPSNPEMNKRIELMVKP